MKRRHTSIVAVLGLIALAGVAHSAGPDMSQWTHIAPVQLAQPPAAGLIEAPLPPELFALARPDLADLRLVTAAGEAVPYVVRTDRGTPGRTTSYAPTRLYNATFLPGRESSLTADFGTRAPRTRIDIDTPGTNFRRRVRVEASQDDTTWQVLKAADWLFRISSEQSAYNKSEVVLPDNDFRYLRVTVYNAPDDPERLTITGITSSDIRTGAPQTVDVPVKSSSTTQDDKFKATEIEIDLGFENLPLHELSLAIEDTSFLRRVDVLGRNVRTRTIVEPVENAQPRKREIEEPWSAIAGGSLYRLPGGDGQPALTGLTLHLNAPGRYLLVRIHNADDAPLKVTGITVRRLQMYVAFRPQPAGPYQLYLGKANAPRPQYDLDQYADRLRSEGVTAATVGPIALNPAFALPVQVVPWSERHALLLWAGLGAVVVILALLVLRQARHAQLASRPDAGPTG